MIFCHHHRTRTWRPRAVLWPAKRVVVFFLCLMFTLAGCAQESQEGRSVWIPDALPAEATETPDTRAIVTRVIDFMDRQQELAAEAFVTYEVLQESGQTLTFDLLLSIAYQKPNKLRWIILFDDGTKETAWFDSGTFSMLKEPALVYGQVEVASTVPNMISELEDKYGLDVPFRDVLSGQISELWLGDDVTSMRYVGEAWVDGAWTDHVALRRDGVDFEMWVAKGEQPFPARISIVLTDEEGMPRSITRFREWKNVIPPAISFDFVPPEGAEQIEVVSVSQ